MSSLVPLSNSTNEELIEMRCGRAKKYGIEEIEKGFRLSFTKDFPQSVDNYADPVNLLFPVETAEQATKSRDNFVKRASTIYKMESSIKKVYTRLIESALGHGEVKYSDSDCDKKLPEATKKRMDGYESKETVTKSLTKELLTEYIEQGIVDDEYEPRKSVTLDTQQFIQKSGEMLSDDHIHSLVYRLIKDNYYLFGPFQPLRYDWERYEHRVWLREIYSSNKVVIIDCEDTGLWKVSYKITKDDRGILKAEFVGTPVAVIQTYSETDKVSIAKSEAIACDNEKLAWLNTILMG